MRGVVVTSLLLGSAAGVHAAPTERGMQQQYSVTYPRASIYEGLPTELLGWVDALIDTRLAPSSMRTVRSALVHWKATCARYGWDLVIASEDPQRGGKMVAFLHYMAEDTTITADSISNYVWGIRAWMKAQRQSDPLMGVENWHDVMLSIRVLKSCVLETWLIPATHQKLGFQ